MTSTPTSFPAIEVETRYGILAVPNIETDVIGRFLARYGEWGWDEVCFVARTLPVQDARVLDVGAFVGTFGLGLAQQRRLGALCFVEASPAVAPLLARNTGRNSPIPAAVVEALVAAPGAPLAAGRVVEAGNLGSTSFASASAAGKAETTPAPGRAVTLADLRAEFGDFDLIKLDVEGMEIDILRSDEDHLSRGSATLWVECNEDPKSLEIVELLLSWDLEVHYFAFPAFNPDNMRGDRTPIFPLAYEAGLLAAPKVAPTLSDELRAHRCILRRVQGQDELRELLWRTPRWGEREWLQAAPEELAALAGRSLRGETFDAYLKPGWSRDAAPREELRQRLQDVEGRLREAEALADQRLRLIDAERGRRESLETAFAEAEARARVEVTAAEAAREAADQRAEESVATLAAERERRARVEAALARSSAQALDRLSVIGAERERTAEAVAAHEATKVVLGGAQAELKAARAVVAEQLLALEAERAERQAAEALAAEARLAVENERGERKAAEALLRAGWQDAEARGDHLRRRLQALKASLSWRLTMPARSLFKYASRALR